MGGVKGKPKGRPKPFWVLRAAGFGFPPGPDCPAVAADRRERLQPQPGGTVTGSSLKRGLSLPRLVGCFSSRCCGQFEGARVDPARDAVLSSGFDAM